MTGRIERIGDATLYLGDSLDILPGLEPAHLGVSDPPYRLTTGGISKSTKTMSGKFAAHNYANDGQLVMAVVDWEDMAGPIFDALADDADCYIMANDKNVFAANAAFAAAGFRCHNLLAWDKIAPTANRWYMKNLEFTLYLWKGRARTINDPSSKQGVPGRHISDTRHPTEKPVWLMESYIGNSSQPGEVVLDPFMGVGTTGVAAMRLNRAFVGIEIDEGYFDLACKRIERAWADRPMFVEAPTQVAMPLAGGAGARPRREEATPGPSRAACTRNVETGAG